MMPQAPPLNWWQRPAFRLVLRILAAARRLPDKAVYRATYAIGRSLYLVMPGRREPLRSNLRRTCRWLVAQEMASPRVTRAASDNRALEAMVRAAFGHWLLGYVEAALGPKYDSSELRARVLLADAAATAEALGKRPAGEAGVIHVALHFGSLDLSAMYGARLSELPFTGPMEIVEDPLARAYFDHVRGELGATIVPIKGAAEHLLAAIERGEVAGMVADRNVVGRGSPVDLFGAPTRLPIGPAVLSVQTGATIYLQAIERSAPGEWLGHTVIIEHDPEAGRREATRSILQQEARAIERIVARAPEQWTTLFFPVWKDEEGT
ncbi:MAG: lysophospholipid acyltransferase family protein [Chloroflexota bacterium]